MSWCAGLCGEDHDEEGSGVQRRIGDDRPAEFFDDQAHELEGDEVVEIGSFKAQRDRALAHIRKMEKAARGGPGGGVDRALSHKRICQLIKRDHPTHFVEYCEVARKNLLATPKLGQFTHFVPLHAHPTDEEFDEVFQLVGLSEVPLLENARWCVMVWAEHRDDAEHRASYERRLLALGVMGADLECADGMGTTALIAAVAANAVGGTDHCPVSLLVSLGADLVAANKAHVTPLLCAAMHGAEKAFAILVEALDAEKGRLAEAVAKTVNSEGASVVHLLVDRNEFAMLALALDREAFRAVVDSRVAKTGETALLDAARHGRRECVVALLRAGADATKASTHGTTPLHAAAQHGQIKIVEVLLDAGASASRKNAKGQSARDLAHAGREKENSFFPSSLFDFSDAQTPKGQGAPPDYAACVKLLDAQPDKHQTEHRNKRGNAPSPKHHHHLHKAASEPSVKATRSPTAWAPMEEP